MMRQRGQDSEKEETHKIFRIKSQKTDSLGKLSLDERKTLQFYKNRTLTLTGLQDKNGGYL
jgi:hypothetical protein